MTAPLDQNAMVHTADAVAEEGPFRFPLSRFLDFAPPSLQYRAIIDVAGFSLDKDNARMLAMSFSQSIRLAMAQSADGSWNNSMLSTPAPGDDSLTTVGTIPAFRRLLEYGWDRESPPLLRARRLLFRLLAEDDDVDQLWEYAKDAGNDLDYIRRSRSQLREAAAAALAQAGYEGDPRLRGAARRILGRVDTYLSSPLAEKPWVRAGSKQVLSADACPPSIHLLTMIAHMPLFRVENHAPVSRILAHVSRPAPRQEVTQLVGKHIVSQPHLILGDPLTTRSATDADVPFTVTWLELMARLQFLDRGEAWKQAFARLLEDRDRNFVWRPRRANAKAPSESPDTWPLFSLGREGVEEDRFLDVTFRLGLIARLMGRKIELA